MKLGIVAVALVCPAVCSANLITLTFDEIEVGSEVGDFYSGVTFVDAKVVANTSTVFVGISDPGPNVIVHSTSGYMPKPDDPIEAFFHTPVDYVSLRGLSIGLGGYRLSGYDALGNLLESKEVVGSGMGGTGFFKHYLLELNSIGISRIAFSQSTTEADSSFWDKLTYQPTSVPEPGTMLLLTSGLVAFGVRRYRKGR